MMFSARPREVADFYRELVGMTGDVDDRSAWLKTSNADVVVQSRAGDDRTPAAVTAHSGFVVWFGVADVNAAHEKAKRAGALVGDFYGDYFFARDPDGRIVGVHASEDHHHDHEH
jgi:predicted enzyme related to lactoylglutathione lyase